MEPAEAVDTAAADGIRKTFLASSARIPPMTSGARLALGCSAGGDSAALVELAADAARERGWSLFVLHLDHAARPESADEAEFVRARCDALGLELVVERAPDLAGASEAAMRAARHDFFRRAVAATGAAAVVLAHQADDRAETFLMRLMAGAGPTGLSGIRAFDRVGGLALARPLLGIRREALRTWLRARGVEWREDPSNADETRDRAWVRSRLIPLLASRAGDAVVERIARASELIEEETNALDAAAATLLAGLTDAGDAPALGRLDAADAVWRAAPEPLRARLTRDWLRSLRPDADHPPGFAAVRDALAFAERGAEGSETRTAGGIRLRKRAGRIEALPPRES